jgi:hypothetical protein
VCDGQASEGWEEFIAIAANGPGNPDWVDRDERVCCGLLAAGFCGPCSCSSGLEV